MTVNEESVFDEETVVIDSSDAAFVVDGIAELHAAIEGGVTGRDQLRMCRGGTDADWRDRRAPAATAGSTGDSRRPGWPSRWSARRVSWWGDGRKARRGSIPALPGTRRTEQRRCHYHTKRHERRLCGESPPKRYELSLQTKTGESLVTEINVTPIQYDGEQAVMASYRDITERKRRENELRRFRRTIETAPHAVVLTEADGTITYVNPAFEDITGYSRDETLGQTPQLYFSDEIPDSLHQEMWESVTDGDVWEGSLVNRRATGELYHAHETVAPIVGTEDTVEGFVGIQTDISERVEREQLVDTLDRVLRHNLRNKLNVVQAHGSLIRTQESENHGDHVATILDSVNDLLETTQKGRKIIKFLSHPSQNRPVESGEGVRRAVRTVRGSFPDARITLDLPMKRTFRRSRSYTLPSRNC